MYNISKNIKLYFCTRELVYFLYHYYGIMPPTHLTHHSNMEEIVTILYHQLFILTRYEFISAIYPQKFHDNNYIALTTSYTADYNN